MTGAPPEFPGNRFVGASWRPGADADLLARLRRSTTGWAIAEGPGWLIASEKAEPFAENSGASVALGRARFFDRRAGRFPGAADIAATLAAQGTGAIDSMAPPFRAVWADRNSGVVRGEVDLFGLGHVFVSSGEGWAMLASSSTLLADIVAAPLSPESLTGFALFGSFLALDTPFSGITKLAGGSTAALEDGRLIVATTHSVNAPEGSALDAFRDTVRTMVDAVPEAELELSGGLDSRLILAAMTCEQRQGRRAITLGVAEAPSPDVTVARGIAQKEGLNWSLLDVGNISALNATALHDLLSRAVAGYDHMGNPVEKVAFMMAGAGRKLSARFGGQNGETLRGFYYAAQPLEARPSDALARRLVSWRLLANDQTQEWILAPTKRRELRANIEQRTIDLLLSFGGTWGHTLDKFYLKQRMQCWAGVSAGTRIVEHTPLYPFFDPDFVAAAMATPSADKLNSKAAYRLLVDLDPSLARLPLADGVTPAHAPATRLGGQVADLGLNSKKLMGRIARRLRGASHSTLGSETVNQRWHRLKLYERLPLHGLTSTGMFDEAALEKIGRGDLLPDRATLGFLLVMAGLVSRP